MTLFLIILFVLVLMITSYIIVSSITKKPTSLESFGKEEVKVEDFESFIIPEKETSKKFTKIVVKKLADSCNLNIGTVSKILSGKYTGNKTPATECVMDSVKELSKKYRLVYKKTTNTRLAELTGLNKTDLDAYFLGRECNEEEITRELELLTYDKGNILYL